MPTLIVAVPRHRALIGGTVPASVQYEARLRDAAREAGWDALSRVAVGVESTRRNWTRR